MVSDAVQYMPLGERSSTYWFLLSKCAGFVMISALGEVVWEYPGIDLGYPRIDFGFPGIDWWNPRIDLGYSATDWGNPGIDFGYSGIDWGNPRIDSGYSRVN